MFFPQTGKKHKIFNMAAISPACCMIFFRKKCCQCSMSCTRTQNFTSLALTVMKLREPKVSTSTVRVTLKNRSRSILFSMVGEGDEMYHWCELGDDCFDGYQFIACYNLAQFFGYRYAPVAPPSCKNIWGFFVGLIFGK